MYTLEDIHAVDPELAAITAEFDRQNSHIELEFAFKSITGGYVCNGKHSDQ